MLNICIDLLFTYFHSITFSFIERNWKELMQTNRSASGAQLDLRTYREGEQENSIFFWTKKMIILPPDLQSFWMNFKSFGNEMEFNIVICLNLQSLPFYSIFTFFYNLSFFTIPLQIIQLCLQKYTQLCPWFWIARHWNLKINHYFMHFFALVYVPWSVHEDVGRITVHLIF